MAFGVKFSSSMALFTRSRVLSLTPAYPFKTFDTVEIATPALLATSLMEATPSPPFRIFR